MRLLLTFATLHKVLAAEKTLRTTADEKLRCRPTPTPAALSQDICGMSLELLDPTASASAVQVLKQANLSPRGVHELS
ncbi:MAG: DUF3343 domain-containing protein [Cyanobacteria bacterium REEB67]|nr:DUF3343 domain-containing protein [Cyanobacteria bacterium REEB67]